MRGENGSQRHSLWGSHGSSPHARGKPVGISPPGVSPGLIPACAGKTAHINRRNNARRAHPRMRGENSSACSVDDGPTGSSPHARGKRGVGRQIGRRGGLIPACAGKTVHQMGISQAAPAHPRMRGENHRPDAGADWCSRLIPACAGKTCGFP